MTTPEESVPASSSQRNATPPLHTAWSTRGLTVPNFPQLAVKNVRVTNTGFVNVVAWSCDGKRVAVCGPEKLARIWVPEKSYEIRNTLALMNGHTEIVDSCSWHPFNPDIICTGSLRDGRVVFWDLKSKTPIQSLNLKPKQPQELLFSPDAKRVIVLTKGGAVVFLGLQKQPDGNEQWAMTEEKLKNHDAECELTSCRWTHHGNGIVAGEKRGHLAYYTYPALKRVISTGAHADGVTSLALDPRGKYIATVGADSIVNLFDTESWRLSNTLDCTEDVVNDIDFSYDGEFIAVAFARSLEIWATETSERIHRVTQPVTPCKTVAWHPWKFALAFGGQSYVDSATAVRLQNATAIHTATLSFMGL